MFFQFYTYPRIVPIGFYFLRKPLPDIDLILKAFKNKSI